MSQTLVVAPSITFEQLGNQIASQGWKRRGAPTDVLTAAAAQEPEFAFWSRADDEGEITYRFDAEAKLRVVEIRGEHAAQHADEITQRVPTLTPEDVRRLLQSTEREEILRGLLAVEALQALPLLEQVALLGSHRDAAIANTATEVFGKLVPRAIEIGARKLAEEKAQRPDRSALFPHLGDAGQRRQILRWLIHDNTEANEHIIGVLRSALEDADWEVRATAILAAVRLKASALGKLIRRVALPESSRSGLGTMDRRILEGLRRTALLLLAGQVPPPPDYDLQAHTREAMPAHMLRCVAGLPVRWHDRVFLFVHSLTEPVAPCEPLPDKLPGALEEKRGRYYLSKTGIELIWVPPVAHWLGDDLEHKLPSNPIREVKPSSGFFAARQLLTRALVRRIDPHTFDGHEPEQPREPTEAGEATRPIDYYTGSWWEAQTICALISQLENVKMTLPTADEWEMIARGPDGRRFPWGNALERNMLDLPSPWGAQHAVGVVGQWTATVAAPAAEMVTCGGSRELRCAVRNPRPPVSTDIGLRPVVRIA